MTCAYRVSNVIDADAIGRFAWRVRVWPAFNMFLQILGPKLCRRLSCSLCLISAGLMLYYIMPVLAGNLISDLIKCGVTIFFGKCFA